MTIHVPDHMRRILDDIARREGLLKPRYAVSEGSQTGDNYLGVLYRVRVSDEESPAALELILKGMPSSARRREEMRVVVYFNNEYNVYRVALPALARFIASKGVDEALAHETAFPYAPRCFEATRGGPEGEDVLALQDMRPLGFIMHDRRQGMDEHLVRACLRALSLLHASSMAMEEQQPDKFAEVRAAVTETLFYADNPLLPMCQEMISKRTYEYINDRFPEGSDGYIKMKDFIDNYASRMCDCTRPYPKSGNAITHGDTWTNNLLFKHSKAGVPERTCLLDFQLTRYSSPVLDIVYLVYCCTCREMRDQHLDGLLREYHDMLAAHLKALGSDVRDLYPWETFQTQLRERAQFGLGMALMTVPMFLADAEELPDLDAQFESGKEMTDMFEFESKSAPERNKRLSDILQEMIDRGLL